MASYLTMLAAAAASVSPAVDGREDVSLVPNQYYHHLEEEEEAAPPPPLVIQKCPKYKMWLNQNVQHPPLQVKPLGQK